MKNDRRRYGLQVQCILEATHQMEWFTPRNLKVAVEMIKTHHFFHPDEKWIYKISDYSLNSTMEPIFLSSQDIEEGSIDQILK